MSDIPALLVVDVQQSFLHAPYWREDNVPVFRENLLKLLDAAAARRWPIVRILHEDEDAHFAPASGLVRPMDWVPDAHDVVFHKRVHNAFTDTGLQAWLRERGIGRVIVTGIRSEQCCETTARVAWRSELSWNGMSLPARSLPVAIVYRLERLYHVTDEPVAIVTSHLPAVLFPKLEDQDLENVSLYYIFEHVYGRQLNWAEEEIGAVTASTENAEILKTAPGTALLFVKEKAYDTRRVPIEFSLSLLRADRYKATVTSVRKH